MTLSASALDARVLVLNRLYGAIRVVDARRAFTLLHEAQFYSLQGSKLGNGTANITCSCGLAEKVQAILRVPF